MGFAVTVNPLADFYTKYYIDVISILWAATFSLLILFLPKLQVFYKTKRSDAAEEKRSSVRHSIFSFLKATTTTTTTQHRQSTFHTENNGTELLSLEQILASDGPVINDGSPRSSSHAVATGNTNFIEVHEGEMPIRKVFRYFPFLSQWEMQHLMVFPWLSYFSHFSVRFFYFFIDWASSLI